MGRNFNDWIEGYLDYTRKQESPTHFHFWSALSVIASVLGRRCFLHRGYFTLYPNLYIVLVAESATCRKSTATGLAVSLLNTTGVDIVREKLTVGYLYKHLAGSMLTGVAGQASAIVIYAPELSTLLGKEAHTSGLVATITSLFECPDKVEYRTKTSGTDIIYNPCVNILGATTLDWMSTNMPGESVEGGFTSRVLFIVGEEARHREAFPQLTAEDIAKKEMLIADLQEIAMAQGQIEMNPEAMDIYRAWYNIIKEPDDPRLKGFYGRKGDHILKVACCLSLSRTSDKIIDKQDMLKAIKIVEEAEKKMPIAFRGVAYSHSAKHIDRILAQIEKFGLKASQGLVAHSDLLRKNSTYVNGKEFAEVISTLQDSGQIQRIVNNGKIFYKKIGG